MTCSQRPHRTLVWALVGLGFACGGESGGTSPGNPGTPPTDTEESLNALGVDTADTERLGDDLEPLPPSYSPLGARSTINRFEELLLFGVDVDPDDPIGPTTSRSAVVDFAVDGSNRTQPELLDGGSTALPWANAGLRRAAAGDFDGDGREELAIVYQVSGETLDLVIQDGAPAFSVGAPAVVGLETLSEVFLEAGDLDGDGVDDLVLAEVTEAGVKVSLLVNRDGRFTPEGPGLSFDAGDHVLIELGHLDYDAPAELALVINQGTGRSAGDQSRARLALYDDLPGGLVELSNQLITVTLPEEVLNVRGGDVALADVDGDGLDEVVFGGLTALGRTCNLESYAALEVWDDRVHQLSALTANKVRFVDRRQPCSSGASHRISRFPIQGLDLDDDRAEEIHALEWIYEDLAAGGGALVELATLPQEEWLSPTSSGSRAQIHWSTTSFAVGDVNSDGRQDLLYYTQRQSQGQYVQAWGLDMIDGWKQLTEVETRFENDEDQRPQIVSADLDEDLGTMGLRYSEGSHQLVFTQPVIIAALAAPPCAEDSSQDLGACTTSFGTGTTSGTSDTSGWSVIAGISVGLGSSLSVAGVKVGSAEAVVNTKSTLRNYKTTAYRTRTRVRRETGPLEDSLIFTSFPYDVYTYEILSHPNPELIGDTIEVRLPREPITIMSTVEFYNARVEEGGPKIDESIFSHVVGMPSTYRSVVEKDRLLRSNTGVESEEVDVGQGGGTTRVDIATFESTTTGRKFQAEATLDVKLNKGGIIAGFKIGGGFDFEFRTLRGSETLYSGTVPNLPEGELEDAYSFGLFAYVHEDAATGQSYEVLDYWVR